MLKSSYCCILVCTVLSSCKPDQSKMSGAERALVKDSMSRMAGRIAKDITSKGPSAWLNYFEDTSDFFMASDGYLVFKDYPTARNFISNTLVKTLSQINLKLSNLRFEPLTPKLCSVGADFSEELTDYKGNIQWIKGYFTSITHYDGRSWKLKNVHWSIAH